MTTAVLFDLDGVLVDSRAAIAGSLNHALAANGLPERTEEELHRFIGPSLANVFAELASQPLESELVVACVASYREHYRDASLRLTTVVPGIPEVVARMAERHRLAVATSKPVAFAEPILAGLGLRGFFTAVAGPDLNPFGETKADTIASALAQLGIERALMVGDRSFDIAGARANGLPAIGVAWGIGSGEELRSAGATRIVERPSDLPQAAADLLVV